MRKYNLAYHLVEGDEAGAARFCAEVNAAASPYVRRRYPASYTPYHIKDNYGPGKDWSGWICWYHR